MVAGVDDFEGFVVYLFAVVRSEPDDPLVPEIAHIYKTDRPRYEDLAGSGRGNTRRSDIARKNKFERQEDGRE